MSKKRCQLHHPLFCVNYVELTNGQRENMHARVMRHLVNLQVVLLDSLSVNLHVGDQNRNCACGTVLLLVLDDFADLSFHFRDSGKRFG